MKKEDLKVGMKVVPKDKTVNVKGLESAGCWRDATRKGQNYLFITKLNQCGAEAICSNCCNDAGGNLFNASDLEPYTESPALPRICYVLGGEDTPLEVGEDFEYKHDSCNSMFLFINNDGEIMERVGYYFAVQIVFEIINHPEKIIRLPKKPEFSDVDKGLMRAYAKAGYSWFARDDNEDKSLFAYSDKPEKGHRSFGMPKSSSRLYEAPCDMLPTLTWENSPVCWDDYKEEKENDAE